MLSMPGFVSNLSWRHSTRVSLGRARGERGTAREGAQPPPEDLPKRVELDRHSTPQEKWASVLLL